MSSDADDREVTSPPGAEGPAPSARDELGNVVERDSGVGVLAEALRGEPDPLAWAQAFSRVFAVTATRRSDERVFEGDDFTGLLAGWLANAMERGAQTVRDREDATVHELVAEAFLEHADRLHVLARNLAPGYVDARKVKPSPEAVARAFAQVEKNERRSAELDESEASADDLRAYVGLDENVPAEDSPYTNPANPQYQRGIAPSTRRGHGPFGQFR